MDARLQALIAEIDREAEKNHLVPPQVVLDIFQKGIIKNQAGTRGQYFSTLVFIQGVARSLAYDCVNNFVYLLDEPSLTCAQLLGILPRYFRANANFLGYCGFDDVWRYAKTIIALSDCIKNKDELSALVNAYNTYLANLYSWIQHYFPWKIGDQFPLAAQEPAQ